MLKDGVFHDKLKFYYDETNNPRKFWIDNKNFNHPVNKNFILGGIVFDENIFNGEIIDIYDKLKKQKSIKELKSRHILKSSFEESLKSKELNIMLKWIYENGIYIHFINIDHISIIIKDIFDITDNNNFILHGDTLYKIFSKNINFFLEILVKYNYPEMTKENTKDFIDKLKETLKELKKLNDKHTHPKNKLEELHEKIIFDYLIKLLDAKNFDKCFIKFKKNKYIIENYSRYYTKKPELFKKSIHIFDKETEIEKIINPELKPICGENKNIIFKNSNEDRFIQISDIIVGLLSRFFLYLEKHNTELKNNELKNNELKNNELIIPEFQNKFIENFSNSIFTFDENQRNNFLLLINLLKKSYTRNKFFFNNENTFVQDNNFELILKICNIDNQNIQFKKL